MAASKESNPTESAEFGERSLPLLNPFSKMGISDNKDLTPVCVASTVVDTGDSQPSGDNYFKSVQWSPDGTTLLANSADHHIRSYIL